MVRLENGLYLLSMVAALVAVACATRSARVAEPKLATPPTLQAPALAHPLPAPPKAAKPTASPTPVVAQHTLPLVEQIRARLPSLKPGMTRAQVEQALRLDTDFHGIVNSEGTREDFAYYYDLGDWELVLRFSYTGERDGAFKKYLLGPIRPT